VTAGGNITDSGALSVVGTSSFTTGATGSIILDSPGNSFAGALSFTGVSAGVLGGDLMLVNSHPFSYGSLTVGGALYLNTPGIAQSGAWKVTGITTLNAGANDITLDTATNDFSTVLATGRNVTLVDTNALDLGLRRSRGT